MQQDIPPLSKLPVQDAVVKSSECPNTLLLRCSQAVLGCGLFQFFCSSLVASQKRFDPQSTEDVICLGQGEAGPSDWIQSLLNQDSDCCDSRGAASSWELLIGWFQLVAVPSQGNAWDTVQLFASSQIVLYNEKQAARKENQYKRAIFSSSRIEVQTDVSFHYPGSYIQFFVLADRVGLVRKLWNKTQCQRTLQNIHRFWPFVFFGIRVTRIEEDLLGRMLESFVCSAFIHAQLFIGSTVANLGQMALAKCRGSIWNWEVFDFQVAGAPVMSTGSILFNMLLTPKRTCGWSACLWVQQVDQQNCVAWFMLHSPIRWAAATFLEHDASFLFNHVETLLSLRRKAAWCFRPGQMSVGVYRCATHPTWHRTTDQRHRAAEQVACNYQQKLPDFRFAKCCMWTSRTLALCGLSNCPYLIFIHVGGGLLQSSRSSFDNTIFSPLAKSFLLNRFIFHVPLGMHLPRKSLRLGTGSLLWEIQKPLKRPSRWIMLNMGFA